MKYLHLPKGCIKRFPKLYKKFTDKGVKFSDGMSMKEFKCSRGFGTLGRTRIRKEK